MHGEDIEITKSNDRRRREVEKQSDRGGVEEETANGLAEGIEEG